MQAQAVSQDTLVARADRLLEEWGRWQRREEAPLQGDKTNPIAMLMENYARRSKTDKRQRWANRKNRRVVEVVKAEGKRDKVVLEMPMSPDRADKQSKGGPRVSQQWPGHVQRVDAVLAAIPSPVLSVLRSYYIAGHTIRIGAEVLRINRNEYDKRLERGRWFLIGKLDAIDYCMSRQ